MAGVMVTAIVLLTIFYKELLVTSFDPTFAQTIGIRVAWIHNAFMFLLSAAVVVALQAVGVVLVSAMLITPAATAYLLTNRMKGMLLVSAVCGVVAGAVGAFVSFLRSDLPTGPCMVVAASTLFGAAVLFSPIHGVLPRWFQRRARTRQVRNENALKAVYHFLEAQDPQRTAITTQELATQQRSSLKSSTRDSEQLASDGLVVFEGDRKSLRLSEEGRRQAEAIVRNHRLWELYLTERANYRPDHVHDDAELIEHVLGEEIVKKLEERLGRPQRDPHGKSIPRPQ
jgi:manganese/zinc/iron transport system permease protein